MKSWSYNEITQITEQQINLSMKLARESQQENRSSCESNYKNFAVGAFILWDSITQFHQKEGDRDRLHKMAGM